MAFMDVITALVIVASFASSILAKDIVVGDDSGWKLNFDYQDWANGKEFNVGDNLIFNYPKGAHNVYKVDGNGFQQCTYPNGEDALTSGKDVITLATPGKKWYICGVGNHCESGMKLVINVQQKVGSSDQNSAAPRGISPQHFAWMIASFVVFMMIMI
ncbi:hypothetical protein ACH5RR_038551 [Cinchona calisaya]|uniref:Phytocyanin domain-containing protein n=1 Tax=Cinchona calisaya TaxID=153742 RepID=A0ABD2Y182_9GENT